MSRRIILASTSPFRRELLSRLGLCFECAAPEYGEGEIAGAAPSELARLHALEKAREVARRSPGALVIGSDQVAELDGEILGKPLTKERAFEQLRKMSGKKVLFHTGVALVADGREESGVELFSVTLKKLTDREIENYLTREEPYFCAGSFKIEGLGIALMESMEGEDYTSLIGLPLIRLIGMLEGFGVRVL
ncbi:septum formation protein Maf [bacterium]|nr:MAG: septum formation protein Maf [bacterium]